MSTSPTGSPRCSPTAASPSPPTSTFVLGPPTPARTSTSVYRITDSTVDSADFIAGIEIGFGQSLDKLAAILAATPSTADADSRPDTNRHRHEEHDMTQQTGGRRVVTNMSLSLDGHYAGPTTRWT